MGVIIQVFFRNVLWKRARLKIVNHNKYEISSAIEFGTTQNYHWDHPGLFRTMRSHTSTL